MLCFVVFCSLKVPEATICSENFNKTACRWDCFLVDLSPCIYGRRHTVQIITFLTAGPQFFLTKVPLILQNSTCMVLSPYHTSWDESSGLKYSQFLSIHRNMWKTVHQSSKCLFYKWENWGPVLMGQGNFVHCSNWNTDSRGFQGPDKGLSVLENFETPFLAPICL